MLLKVDNQYLDFTEDIDVDRQAKVFDDAINNVSGDVSYDFTIDATSKNIGILSLYSINQAGKIIYAKVPAIIEDNGGIPIYFGFLKVGRKKRKERKIECTFYSGNSNWISLLPESVRDVDLSEFDEDFTYLNVDLSWIATSGLIYPIINTGAMTTRSYVSWTMEDMHPFIYVKDVISRMFSHAGLKIDGTLLNEFRYQKMITTNNDKSIPQDELNNRKTYVSKSASQTITAGAAPAVITFPTTTGTYYPGDLWNTGTHRYTADTGLIVDLTLTINVTITAGDVMFVLLYKNGSFEGHSVQIGGIGSAITGGTRSLVVKGIELDSTDFIDVRAEMTDALMDNGTVNSATISVAPTKIFKTFAKSIVPDGSGQDFLYDIIAPFNPLITYDELSKTVYFDLFKNVPVSEEIDLSRFINTESIEEDYTEFISDYGEINTFSYKESNEEEAKRYNRNNTIPYAGGQIDSGNENVAPVKDVVSLGLAAVFETNVNPFSTYLPKLSYREIQEDFEDTATITNDAGTPVFTVGASHGFEAGDLVRVEDSTVESYNGEWVVASITATEIKLKGTEYESNATATVVKLIITDVEDTNQIVLLAAPDIDLEDFTNVDTIYVDGITVTPSVGTAYFYKPLQGLDIDNYKTGLSFSEMNIPNAHQHNYLEDYWRDTESILQDPVKVFAESRLPVSVFRSLDFKRPIRLKTENFNSVFYLNRISGFKSSDLPCEVELIKL